MEKSLSRYIFPIYFHLIIKFTNILLKIINAITSNYKMNSGKMK